jgi:hypothetical protein
MIIILEKSIILTWFSLSLSLPPPSLPLSLSLSLCLSLSPFLFFLSSLTHSLVSDRHIQSNTEYIRLHEEKAKSGDKSVEVAVISGERYQKEKPRVKKEKETASTDLEEAGPSGTVEGPVPLINVQDYSLLLPRQQNEEGEEEEGGLDNDENKSDDIMEVGSVVSEADSVSAIGNSIPDPDSKGTAGYI